MSSVHFDPDVGGDGLTVSDDDNPTTTLARFGWKTRLVPAFANIVAIGTFVKTKAAEAAAAVATTLGYRNEAATAAANAAASATAAAGHAAAIDPTQFVAKAGGTMTGRLGLSVNGLHVATRENISTRTDSGFFQATAGTSANGWPLNTASWQHLIASTHAVENNYYSFQLAADFFNQRFFARSTNNSGATAWSELYHSGRTPVMTSRVDWNGELNLGDLTSSAVVIDWSARQHQATTITRNITLTLNNRSVGRLQLKIVVSGTRAITWPAMRWYNNAPPPSQTNATLLVFFYWDGSVLWGSWLGGYPNA